MTITASASKVFTLRRSGTFSVDSVDRQHQYGNVGTDVLQYRVTVQGGMNDLNPQGWLLDNNDIPRYFKDRWHNVPQFPSCEQLAETACEDIAGLVRSNGGRARRIEVSVSGIPGSEIVCEWKDDRQSTSERTDG